VYLFATLILAAVATVPSPAPSPQLPAVPVVAPGYAAPNASPPPPGIVGVTQQPFVGITLENAIGMALSQNPNLQIAQANRHVAQYGIEAAQGAYDVQFLVQPQYQYSIQPPQNAFFAGPGFSPIVNRTGSLTAGIQGVTRSGQQYSASVSGNQTYNNTAINTFDPYYPTIFSLGFTQPLARNRGINELTRQLELSQINEQSVTSQSLTTVSSTIALVQDTYWNLVAAWRNVAIQEEALKDTIIQQHSNVRLARRGASAPIDVVQVNAQIAVFQQQVFSALQQVGLLQNQLKSQLTTNPNDAIWRANLVPVTPVRQIPTQLSLVDLVTQAMRNRPELSTVREQLQSAAVNLRFAENQTKPQINLQLGYASSGFAGAVVPPGAFLQSQAQQIVAINQLIAAVNPTLPPNQQITPIPNQNLPVPKYLTGGLGESIKTLLSNDFPTYTAGVQVVFPIGNHTAKADMASALEQQRIAQIQEAATIQQITMEVRDALQTYQSAQAQLLAARAARDASEQVLASEIRRFHAGESTTYLVLQREIEVADNRAAEVSAQTNLNKAVVELQRSTGTILSANNVNITTVGGGAQRK
jgi:outer membrane protein TolC